MRCEKPSLNDIASKENLFMKNARLMLGLSIVVIFLLTPVLVTAANTLLYYPPEWTDKAPQAKAIAEALSQGSGMVIQPRIAHSYPEIVETFAKNQPLLIYVGSFLQALLHARGLVPIVQAIDGKEFYTSILIAPSSAGTDPVAIVKNAGSLVSYSKGTSSGESGAKAATGGEAAIATNNHGAAVSAVKLEKAKCAFVKNWWWEGNKAKYEGMNKFDYPGVSDHKNPDNVLSANRLVSSGDIGKLKAAAMKNPEVFQVKTFNEFAPALLAPSLHLMRMGKIDPKTYTW
jgi:hypothetical protein